MYAYCNNNPVAFCDTSGEFPLFAILTIAAFVVAGGVWGYTREEPLAFQPVTPKQPTTSDSLPSNPLQPNPFVPSPAQPNIDVSSLPDENANHTSSIDANNGLTTGDRVKNTLIGASLGLMVGGAFVATAGAAGSLIVGSATTPIAVFGGTGAQTFAIGALAYNGFAIAIAPLFAISIDPIEVVP